MRNFAEEISLIERISYRSMVARGICLCAKGLKSLQTAEAELSDELSIAAHYSLDKGDDRHLLCAAYDAANSHVCSVPEASL